MWAWRSCDRLYRTSSLMCSVAGSKPYFFCLLKEIRHKSSDYPHRVAKYPENRNRNRYRDVSPCKYLFCFYSSTFSSLFATEACGIFIFNSIYFRNFNQESLWKGTWAKSEWCIIITRESYRILLSEALGENMNTDVACFSFNIV